MFMLMFSIFSVGIDFTQLIRIRMPLTKYLGINNTLVTLFLFIGDCFQNN